MLDFLFHKTYRHQDFKGWASEWMFPATKSCYPWNTKSRCKWKVHLKIQIFIPQEFLITKLGLEETGLEKWFDQVMLSVLGLAFYLKFIQKLTNSSLDKPLPM